MSDKLLGLKDILNYAEPNFIGEKKKLYLVRCYQCPDIGNYGRENWAPAVAQGACAWCGWEADPDIVAHIIELQLAKGLPPKRGLTPDEVRERYPEQFKEALRIHRASLYTPYDQEDDGEID